MPHPSSPPTTVVAILGTNSLPEGILARLLEEVGYTTRIIEVSPTAVVDEVLDGVDILLLAPGLKDGVREDSLEAMRSTPQTAGTPVLSLSPSLKLALLDELAVSASWRSLFDELVGQVVAALGRAAAGGKG
jgi:hypothetical protein